MSKTQFPLPKGIEINNIEIDVKNNLLTIVYEEEKPGKKPLYVNQYGTEFFKGDEHYKIADSLEIVRQSYFLYDERNFRADGTLIGIFRGSKKDCHRYLYENWDKLNK